MMNRPLPRRFIIPLALCVAPLSLNFIKLWHLTTDSPDSDHEQAAIRWSHSKISGGTEHDIGRHTSTVISSALPSTCPKPSHTGIDWNYYTFLPQHNSELVSRARQLTQDPTHLNDTSNIPHRLVFTHYINLLNCSIWQTDNGASPQWFNLAQNVLSTINLYKSIWDDLEVVFLQDDDCIGAIREVKPDLVGWFNVLDGMYKADICRAAYLYLYGGYYFDVDVLVLRPYVAPESANFITIKGDEWPDNGFFQAFLAASKEHAVLRKSIDIMVEMLWENNRHYLGPMSLMKAWMNVTDAKNDDAYLLSEANMDAPQSIHQYPKLNNLLSTSRDELVQNVPKEFVHRCQFSSGACNVVVLDEKDETIYFYSRLIGTTWCGRQMECTESKDHISTKTKVASHLQPDAVDSLNGAGNTIKDHTNLSPSNQLDSQSSRIAEDMFDKFEDVLQDQHTRLTPQPPPQDMWLISSSESTRQQTNRIPKIINRIYFAKDGNYPAVVSNAIKQAHKSWLDNNPGYHVRYFNLIKARRYLLKHFHPVFLRAFDCIEAFAGKSDLFRMALLYREGGFHADWKTVCLEKNLLERISNGTDFFVTKGFFAALDYGGGFVKKSRSCAANAFVGARSQHPIIASYLDYTLKNVQSSLYGAYVLMTTGPCVLGRAILAHEEAFGNDTVSWPIHLPGYIHWKGQNSQAIVATKCPGRAEGQDWSEGNNYISLWKDQHYYCEDAASIFPVNASAYSSTSEETDSNSNQLDSKPIGFTALPEDPDEDFISKSYGERSTPVAAATAAARPITVFYNVYADPDHIDNAQDIVTEQMQHLLPEHRVFVRSIGAQFPIENATRIRHDQEGSESETLGLLWNYCRDSPHTENDTVVYIHTKGSFHPSDENTMFRRWITPAALSRECSQMPPFCNICSFRFSPLPHPHSPGNMWAARCSYIKLLLDPTKFEWIMEQFYTSNKMKESPPEIGTGRFAAEHWVHSHPASKACDLSTSPYAWGYEGIPTGEHVLKLQQAPRYNKKMFMIFSGWGYYPKARARWLHTDHRLMEYMFLYNETPPETWFGWSFYNLDALKPNPHLGWKPAATSPDRSFFRKPPNVEDGWIPDVTMVRRMLMHGKDQDGNTFPPVLDAKLCQNMNNVGDDEDDANKMCLSHTSIKPSGPMNSTTVTIDPSSHFGVAGKSESITIRAPTLMCLIYTMSEAHSRISAMRETWAGGCDGFLAFSTESDPRLPTISVPHAGPEEYSNMWQKVRSIWKFVGTHYLDEFDWFLIGGDDLFVLPPNLKTYLASLAYKDRADPKSHEYFVGRRFKIGRKSLYFNSGGAGYVLSQAALRKFLAHIDDAEHCSADKHTAEEDVEIASCLSYLGISVTDTRDAMGRERFHPFSPAIHYQWKHGDPDFAWFEIYNKEWGIKTGKDCCAPDSISFHYIQNARIVRHLQALLYFCDNDRNQAMQLQLPLTSSTGVEHPNSIIRENLSMHDKFKSIPAIPKNLAWTNVTRFERLQTPKCLGPFKHCCIGQCRQEKYVIQDGTSQYDKLFVKPDFDTAGFQDLLIALQQYINVHRANRHEPKDNIEWCTLWFVGDSTSSDHSAAAVCELSSLAYDIEKCQYEFSPQPNSYGQQELNYCRDLPNPDSFFLDDPRGQTIQIEMTSKANAYCPKVRIKFYSPLKNLGIYDGNVVKFNHRDEVGIILFSWGVHANSRQTMSKFMREEFHPFYNSVANNAEKGQYVLMFREHEPQHYYSPGGIYTTGVVKVKECNTDMPIMYDNYRNEEAEAYLKSEGMNDVPIVRLFDALKPLANLHYGDSDCTHYCYSPWRFRVTWHGMILGIKEFVHVSDNDRSQALQLQPPLSSSTWHCQCVDCDEDEVCGGLWRANRYPGMLHGKAAHRKKLHLVVAHCSKSLKWLSEYIKDFNAISIHVLSKCQLNVEGVPANAIVKVLPNLGRNDHSFAHYISTILPEIAKQDDDSVVVFLKDSINEAIHQGGRFRQLDLESLVSLASSDNGFACGLGITNHKMSAYHDRTALSNYWMWRYIKGSRDYNHTGDSAPFHSTFSNLGDFYNSIKTSSDREPEVIQVCYGGFFASSTVRIFKQDMEVWKSLEKRLERGDNIQEGHYAERSWARLLATPLKRFQVEALQKYSDYIEKEDDSVQGPLMKK